jgi:AcrR family transcriptional regulator
MMNQEEMRPAQANIEDQSARERLMTAAVEIFAEQGYAATSVREIVGRAGVSKPVLYYYFGSKEGLFNSIIEAAADQQKATIKKLLAAEGTTEERLTLFFEGLLAKIRRNRNMVRLMNTIILGPPSRAPEVDYLSFRRRTYQAIERIVEQGAERGEVQAEDAPTLAGLIMAVMDSIVINESIRPGYMTPETAARMTHLLKSGFAGER